MPECVCECACVDVGGKVCAVLGRVEEGREKVWGKNFVERLRNMSLKEVESIGSKDPFTL